MVKDPAKPFFSNIAVSDVFVPVAVRPERRFGIVGVDHLDIVDAQLAVNFGDGFLEPGRSRGRVRKLFGYGTLQRGQGRCRLFFCLYDELQQVASVFNAQQAMSVDEQCGGCVHSD